MNKWINQTPLEILVVWHVSIWFIEIIIVNFQEFLVCVCTWAYHKLSPTHEMRPNINSLAMQTKTRVKTGLERGQLWSMSVMQVLIVLQPGWQLVVRQGVPHMLGSIFHAFGTLGRHQEQIVRLKVEIQRVGLNAI